MRYDMSKDVKVDPSLEPQTLGADATVNGASVDLKGFHAATVIIDVGAWTDGTHTFEIQEADDDGAGSPGSFAGVAAADLVGTEPVVDGATVDDQQYLIGYIGDKRHLRVSVTSASVTTGLAAVASYVMAGKPSTLPVA